ncbi:amino acid ABC transporter permease [Tumebacillus permanentifrigoris]|uniref:Amino acid ABC transporter membrane protein 1 (PAAT family) n=1 Tax=Tumebacillus permanentifrigoris TaxID=378543 RepID=A0A316DAA7_9BACL|nr:amino acid ABC transporter permease [Tumebacillus permanentifrigoris]PWK13431.1 amino acid ABC transporter membrane protein 1 (PAAT family) [Tumebacillus permanentifrigoris]
MIDFTILTTYQDEYLKGFMTTIEASLLGLVGSFIIGVIIAVFRISSVRPLRWFGTAYVEFLRNIPLLITVFVFYHGLPVLHINLSGFASGTLGLAVYTSAFIAEAIRAGINAVPKGQMEAGRSSGLTYIQTMRYVILPQAIKVVIPPLGNQFINLVKNSSILGVVAGLDLMYFGDTINSETFDVFSTYIFVGLFYLVLTIPLSLFVGYLERRLARAY